jgi:hypothetical protein
MTSLTRPPRVAASVLIAATGSVLLLVPGPSRPHHAPPPGRGAVMVVRAYATPGRGADAGK